MVVDSRVVRNLTGVNCTDRVPNPQASIHVMYLLTKELVVERIPMVAKRRTLSKRTQTMVSSAHMNDKRQPSGLIAIGIDVSISTTMEQP